MSAVAPALSPTGGAPTAIPVPAASASASDATVAAPPPAPRVVVVAPVYRNAASLPELVARCRAAVPGVRVRLVIDASPDDSLTVANALAAAHPGCVAVTALPQNVGQHRALLAGLIAEPDADVWVTLDADLQDPPEAIPALLAELERTGSAGVFAGRRGTYQSIGRTVTGRAHRVVLSVLTALPTDAGAYLAMTPVLRARILDGMLHRDAPSVVAAAGVPSPGDRGRLSSVPVARDVRVHGESAWTSSARARQSAATIRWAARERLRPATALARWTSFAAIGALGTLAYFALFVLLRDVVPAQPANALARVLTAVATTWANSRHTFGRRTSVPRLVFATAAGLAVGVGISAGVLDVEQSLVGTTSRVAELAALVIATLLTTAGRYVVLRRVLDTDRRGRPFAQRAPARRPPAAARRLGAALPEPATPSVLALPARGGAHHEIAEVLT